MKLNQYIRKRREDLGYTQAEFAKMVGMHSAQHLCNVETNGIAFPRNKYKKLRKALKISSAEFIDVLVSDFLDRIREFL